LDFNKGILILEMHGTNIKKDATVYQILLFIIYMKLNMFQATHRPSSGALNCTGSLWFFIRGRLFVPVQVGFEGFFIPTGRTV